MDPTPDPASQPVPSPAAPSALTSVLKPPQSHGRRGKVARLPKATRNEINTMIEDGLPYLEIIEKLGPDGKGLTENCLSTWKAGGYVDWQRQQTLAALIEKKHQLAESIVAKATDDNASGHAVLQIIATNLCEFLTETDPATLRESLLSDSDKFTRFVNSMVRLAEGNIKCGIFKFRVDDRAAESKASADQPGISDESLHKAEKSLKLL